MAGDPEKRLQRIMDRIYQPPKPKPQIPSGGGAASSQRKRAELSSSGVAEGSATGSKVAGGSKEAPLRPCRPWDRGDLMRRMASFKARTWFGRPKVVGPVNCARRGWVNVDIDTIACETCGSRLLFSIPSSWTFQQVENAAAVFSLKLDNGHKQLCPWVDNLCNESLASFPPTPAPDLIEAYRQRSSSLLQLSGLPIISKSALKYMKCQELDDFLKRSMVACTLDNGVKLISHSSEVGDVMPEAKSSNIYVKAQKIIALCGWELRLLPYIVGCEKISVHNKTKGSSDSSGQSFNEKNDITIVCTENSLVESSEMKGSDSFFGFDCDPASAALDCKLCGACVGLWAFDTIACPLECYTLVDSPGADDQNNAASNHAEPAKMDSSDVGKGRSDSSLMANGGHMNLNLSIAGGVLPTSQQHFRPRISLPIISRHLRAQIALASEIKNYVSSDISISSVVPPLSPEKNRFHEDKVEGCDIILSAETTNGLKRKRNDVETCCTRQDDSDIPSKVRGDVGSWEVSLDFKDPLKNNSAGTEMYLETEEHGGMVRTEAHNRDVDSVISSRTEEAEDVLCEGKADYNQESVRGEIIPIDNSKLSRDSIKNGSAGTEVHLETEEHGGAVCTHAHSGDVGFSEISSRAVEDGDVPCEGQADYKESAHANEIITVEKSENFRGLMEKGLKECGGSIHTEGRSRDDFLEMSCVTKEAGDVPCLGKADNIQVCEYASEIVPADKSELLRDLKKNGSSGIVVHLETEDGGAIFTKCHSRESPNRSSDAKTPADLYTCEDDLMSQLLDISCANDISAGIITNLEGDDPLKDTFCLEQGATAGGDTALDQDRVASNQPTVDVNASCQDAGQLEKSPVCDERQPAPIEKTGDKLVPAECDTAKAFDPLQHHKPFCPWISTGGQGKPGWKLTLLALDREEGSPSPAKEARMRLLSEKEDPIVSVRRLFESPLKRLKNN